MIQHFTLFLFVPVTLVNTCFLGMFLKFLHILRLKSLSVLFCRTAQTQSYLTESICEH